MSKASQYAMTVEALARVIYDACKAVNDLHGLGDYPLPWDALAENDYARDEFRSAAMEAIKHMNSGS